MFAEKEGLALFSLGDAAKKMVIGGCCRESIHGAKKQKVPHRQLTDSDPYRMSRQAGASDQTGEKRKPMRKAQEGSRHRRKGQKTFVVSSTN